jgi:uncharacterized membrane protein YkoI
MNPTIQNCRRQCLVAGLVLLSTLASYAALADVNARSAGVLGQSVPANQQADADQRFLALFRAAPLSLTQAIAVAEALHAGSRTAAITFDTSGPPGYRVRTVKNNEIWENVIDVLTGRTAGHELAWSLNELDAEERDNVIALRSVGQELSEAVAIAEKTAAGKAISGGVMKESDQVNFAVVVLSDDRLKEVFLEPPRPHSRTHPTTARKN